MNRAVVVVLGAAVRPGGTPSPALRRRIDHAVSLVRERPDARLLLTGGVGQHPPSEAEVMARVAERAGVPRERMLLEECATNTRESARRCSELLRDDDCSEVWIVTDAYHQRRARLAFKRVGLAVRATSPAAGDRARRYRRIWRGLREWIGLAWYWLTFRG